MTGIDDIARWLPGHPILQVLQTLTDLAYRQTVAQEQQASAQKQRDRISSQQPTRLPKHFNQFTGDPDKLLEEYRRWEEQADRVNFRTWRDWFEQFEECIKPGSRMDDLYQVWKYGKVLATLRHYAIYHQADEVWMAMYIWVRSQAFLSAELDPKAAMRVAKQAW